MYIRTNKLDVFAIMETSVRDEKFFVFDSFSSKWSLVTNKGLARNVCIVVLWSDQDVELSVLRAVDQCIQCYIRKKFEAFAGYISFIYAMNTTTTRGRWWDLLDELQGSIQEPWLVLGDFNVVLAKDEKQIDSGQVRDVGTELVDMMECCGLTDLQYVGCNFTWSYSHTWCKLDFALVNDA